MDADAARMIGEAREVFARRDESSDPAIGYYARRRLPADGSFRCAVATRRAGLLHLLVRERDVERSEVTQPGEDMAVLLVRALGGEADKLAMLRHAEHDLRERTCSTRASQSLATNLDLPSLLEEICRQVPEVMGAERCSIMLLDEATHELVLHTADTHSGEARDPASLPTVALPAGSLPTASARL